MNLFKRFAALLLAVLLVTGLFPVHAFAQEQEPLTFETTYINPLYADIVSAEDIPHAVTPKIQTYEAVNYVTTVEEAGSILRAQMKDRAETAVVNIFADVSTQEQFDALCDALIEEVKKHTGDPEEGDYIYWHLSSYSANAKLYSAENGYNIDITFSIDYLSSAAQENEMDTAVSDLLSQLNLSGKSDYEKVKAVYDYICKNVRYDDSSSNDLKHTAYAALINKTAVCQGYASLLYRLLLELDVDTRVIAGIGNGGPHGWNIVELDNFYYNADSTWDEGQTTYSYFLKSPAHFEDHERYEEYETSDFHTKHPMASSDYHVHSYTEVVTKPTCTEQGYTTYTCSQCRHSYSDNYTAESGHSWNDGEVTKEPTAAEPGIKTFTCKACGETRTDTIPALTPVQRISGKDRVKTALSVAKALKDTLKDTLKVDKFNAVIIATGMNEKFADALAGSYLANVKRAPILLYNGGSKLSDLNVEFIKKNLRTTGTVYILGGTGAIPATVENDLSGYTVKRLSGTTRYETNLAILKEAGVASANEILIATGNNFADSLSASAVGRPLMLVNGKASKLNDAQLEFLQSVKGKKITIIGGTGAVSDAMKAAIEAATGATAERISGETRYDTSVKIAEKYFPNAEFALLTYAWNFPDGLAGGPLAYAKGAPLLLTHSGKEYIAGAYIAENGITEGYVLGGEAAVSDATARKAFDLAADAAINRAYYTE